MPPPPTSSSAPSTSWPGSSAPARSPRASSCRPRSTASTSSTRRSTRSSTSSPTRRWPRPTRSAPATSGRSPACPIAIKNNRAVAGKRLTFGADFFGDFAAPFDHNVVAPAASAAGFIVVGTTTLPECGHPARHRDAPLRRDAQPVGHATARPAARPAARPRRSPRGWCRSRTPTTAAARSASRPPAAGSSASSPSAAGCRWRPEAGEQFLVVDGVLTRTVRETAAVLDVLAGPELGDASWAPEPDEPFAASAAREPRRLRIAMTTQSPLEAEGTAGEAGGQWIRSARAPSHDAADLLRSLGHEVVEDAPPWTAPGDPRAVHRRLRTRDLHPDRLRVAARRPRADRRRHGAAELGHLGAVRGHHVDPGARGRDAAPGLRPRRS